MVSRLLLYSILYSRPVDGRLPPEPSPGPPRLLQLSPLFLPEEKNENDLIALKVFIAKITEQGDHVAS